MKTCTTKGYKAIPRAAARMMKRRGDSIGGSPFHTGQQQVSSNTGGNHVRKTLGTLQLNPCCPLPSHIATATVCVATRTCTVWLQSLVMTVSAMCSNRCFDCFDSDVGAWNRLLRASPTHRRLAWNSTNKVMHKKKDIHRPVCLLESCSRAPQVDASLKDNETQKRGQDRGEEASYSHLLHANRSAVQHK